MLYCKNAVQQGRPFTLDPRILYRGLLMSVTNMGVLTGAQVLRLQPATLCITGDPSLALALAPALGQP